MLSLTISQNTKAWIQVGWLPQRSELKSVLLQHAHTHTLVSLWRTCTFAPAVCAHEFCIQCTNMHLARCKIAIYKRITGIMAVLVIRIVSTHALNVAIPGTYFVFVGCASVDLWMFVFVEVSRLRHLAVWDCLTCQVQTYMCF